MISTHTLTWSVTGGDVHAGCVRNYFNSHAHVERDRVKAFVHIKPVISTHTLTWSVTLVFVITFSITTISTHTLTWSVTQNRQ